MIACLIKRSTIVGECILRKLESRVTDIKLAYYD
jgi:hypothetical protein